MNFIHALLKIYYEDTRESKIRLVKAINLFNLYSNGKVI